MEGHSPETGEICLDFFVVVEIGAAKLTMSFRCKCIQHRVSLHAYLYFIALLLEVSDRLFFVTQV